MMVPLSSACDAFSLMTDKQLGSTIIAKFSHKVKHRHSADELSETNCLLMVALAPTAAKMQCNFLADHFKRERLNQVLLDSIEQLPRTESR